MQLRKTFYTILLVVFLIPPMSLHAAQGRRVALVIGNSNYTNAPLRNPVNDATDMAAALRELGFSVTLLPDANQRSMEEAIRDFGRALRSGGVGLFYFAGHGIQYQGRNYLIPVHSEIKSEADVKYEAVDAGRVLAQMEEAGNGLNIIILDACRNNPFARSFRSSEQGLAKMDAPTGSILAYATAPGSVAADGSGRNGLYTEKLLKHMRTPGVDLPHLFMNVRKDVVAVTDRQQVPWESSSLIGDFYFVTGRGIAVTEKETVSVAMAPPPPEPVQRNPDKIKNEIGQEFVYIKPGTFMMGSPTSEPHRVHYEHQHKVTLSKGFYLQTTEVTQGQWRSVMGDNYSYFSDCGVDCPVEWVNWDEVQDYIKKLNRKTGGRYRLPTEAEWEYAARSGSTGAYCYGNGESQLAQYGWYSPISGKQTHPVGQKQPNKWGLYDMHGNVWEWVQDRYGNYPRGSVTDPKGPSSGDRRILRGGCWDTVASVCRSANRFHSKPGWRGRENGFRLAMDPPTE